MGATFLMSYPGPDWYIRGAANFRSQQRESTNPRRALQEWIALCDAITRAGGRILVLPPASDATGAPLTGMVYTANAGQVFHVGDGWEYLVSNMSVAHRQAEQSIVREFVERAGLTVAVAAQTWEGQADLQFVVSNRYIATYGVRSVRASVDEVRRRLPPGSQLLELEMREPFFHGDVALNPIKNRAGDTLLLAHDGAFAHGGVVAIRRFLGERTEVYPVDRDDTLGYACNALCVNGTVFLPSGLSTQLRSDLVRRGFVYEEVELTELFGKGGGGPRCLVNDLRGLVVNPGAPDFASLRDEICALVDRYPESYEPATPAPPEAPPSTPETAPAV